MSNNYFSVLSPKGAGIIIVITSDLSALLPSQSNHGWDPDRQLSQGKLLSRTSWPMGFPYMIPQQEATPSLVAAQVVEGQVSRMALDSLYSKNSETHSYKVCLKSLTLPSSSSFKTDIASFYIHMDNFTKHYVLML